MIFDICIIDSFRDTSPLLPSNLYMFEQNWTNCFERLDLSGRSNPPKRRWLLCDNSIHLYIYIFIYRSIYLSIYPSIYPYILFVSICICKIYIYICTYSSPNDLCVWRSTPQNGRPRLQSRQGAPKLGSRYTSKFIYIYTCINVSRQHLPSKRAAFRHRSAHLSAGADCEFCHLCDSGEKKRRAKQRAVLRKGGLKGFEFSVWWVAKDPGMS